MSLPLRSLSLALAGVTAVAVALLFHAATREIDAENSDQRQCETNCYPHLAQIIDAECFCAVDNGWLDVVAFNNAQPLSMCPREEQ